MHDIIIRPIITEKSMHGATRGRFTFEVSPHAHKREIKHAVEKLFAVTVVAIATTIVKGRSVRAGMKRIEMKKNPWKKASVQLKEGQKIELFDVQAQ